MTTVGLLTLVLLILVVVLLGAVLARLRSIESELARALRRRRRPPAARTDGDGSATVPRRRGRE